MQKYEIIKFEDGDFNLDVNVSPNEDTVWLTQNDMARLFETERSSISKHIRNILLQEELTDSVCAKIAQTGSDNKVYNVQVYNLDMIISVGYRVNSKRGILFRKWATSVLKEYMFKGYSIDEKRCLECQENIITLNNKVEQLTNTINNNQTELKTEYLFYEGEFFEPYSFIRKIFLSSKNKIIIIDGYVNIEVLDMLNDINVPIIIYTFQNAPLTNQDISKFQTNHNLTIFRTNKIHDRFIIVDDEIYMIGSSIKDLGKKRTYAAKANGLKENKLIEDL